MEYRELTEQTWRLIEPHLAEQGYELVELEFGRQGRSLVVRIYMDKLDGAVTLDDCVAASQLLGPVLDKADAFDEHYLLEVSSPGFDRPLRKAADFARFQGEPVRVVSRMPVAGRSRFKGVLAGFEDGLIRLDCDGEPCCIHIENLKSARLDR